MKKKSKINVTVPPKKATETLDNSTAKELTDTKKKSPQNDVNVVEAPNEQIPSRNRNVDTLFKDGKSKPRGFAKAAKYAVTDYIPLGALHRLEQFWLNFEVALAFSRFFFNVMLKREIRFSGGF